eukprot:Nitzschia sp. Nitz4//scaffold62_size106224//27228//28825//NITZ4_004346-RA/size106224-snap-gene-0.111-mRNA-1//1//CDS//3329555826//2613//frame0
MGDMDPTTYFVQARRLLEDIDQESVVGSTMTELVTKAVPLFDHYFVDVHNKLLVGGADKVLVACLDFAVADEATREAIDPICQILSMIYRCDNDYFQDSISIVGGELFPPLLATLFFNRSEFPCPDSASSLMRRLNQVQLDLRDVPWACSLLGLFRDVIGVVDPDKNVQPLSFVMGWLVEGLLLRSDHNKYFLMQQHQFFDVVIQKFSSTFQPGRAVNLQVAKFLRILSMATVNRMLMTENFVFFKLLFLLSHDTSKECLLEVLETLKLAAVDKAGRKKVRNFLGNKFVSTAVTGLDDPVLRTVSVQLLSVLSINDGENVLITKHPEVVEKLRCLAICPSQCSVVAAQTLAQVVSNTPPKIQKVDMIKAILSLCASDEPRVRCEGSFALLQQVRRSPASSFLVVHDSEAMSSITSLAADEDATVRTGGIEILAWLSSNPLNMLALARDSRILETLAANAVANVDPSLQRIREQAEASLARLAKNQRSRVALAKQNRVVHLLSEMGILVQDN